MWETAVQFLETNATALSAAGGLVAVILFIWAIVKWPFSKPNPTQLAPDTIEQIKPSQAKDGPALTIPEFIRLRRELKADLEQELAEASGGEKAQLRARIAELESQIANPDAALAEARKRIADLEALLDREGNHIGGDRINEAKAALEQGDYSLADAIFAEIEARNELAVLETARAAYGRGEVAEAEVRWQDAATHYGRAAQLDPSLEALFKATELAQLAGEYERAERFAQDYLALARASDDQRALSLALDRGATVQQRLGRYPEAERFFREALKIGCETVGEAHPDYANQLNNLAGVVRAQGRYPEAENLYREALEIGKATIGAANPNYAIHLNNLAGVVRAQGRVDEAEELIRAALEIDRKTIGTVHPDYAIHLNNLALVVEAQGRVDEAEGLYREALKIGRKTIGEAHPEYAIRLGNLGDLLGQTGRVAEGRAMLEQALAIFRAALPADHPHIAATQRKLSALPAP